MKLLLHSCCAPCSGAILETLVKEGVETTVYFCNPNIYPREEYLKRKCEIQRYCAHLDIPFVDADYTHAVWLQCVAGLENEPERGARCTECFKHRLLSAAQYAAKNGFDTLATTLASSRWKNLDQVNAAGKWAVEQVCRDALTLTFWERNWRKGGLQERRCEIIREQQFYNQQYCGCEFSVRNQ